MRRLLIVSLTLMALVIGCDNLPIGGKCYDSNGDELTHVIDADGTEWNIKKTTLRGSDYCSIPREAEPYTYYHLMNVKHPNGQDIGISHRHHDKWILERWGRRVVLIHKGGQMRTLVIMVALLAIAALACGGETTPATSPEITAYETEVESYGIDPRGPLARAECVLQKEVGYTLDSEVLTDALGDEELVERMNLPEVSVRADGSERRAFSDLGILGNVMRENMSVEQIRAFCESL